MTTTTTATVSLGEVEKAIVKAMTAADDKGRNWHYVRVATDGTVYTGEEVRPMSATTKTLWLIEKTGPTRQAWLAKSKTVAGAMREAGVRHFVATCETGRLTDGCKLHEDAVNVLVSLGSIQVVG